MGRWRVAVALTLLLGWVTTARADVADYLGKPITAVRVESEGRRVEDRALLALLETTVGRPLAMRDVRASIAHVFSLGRFADVVVRARPSLSGVALVYELQPIHPVRAIRILGSPGADGFDRGGLRRELEERFGVSPPAGRAGEMASFLAARLRDRGYRRATVMPRVDVDPSAGRSTLVFDVTAGTRTRVAAVEVSGGTGAGAVAPARVLERLEISAGAAYEPEALQARVERYVQGLKDLGHYNARVGVAPEFSGDEATVRLAVNVVAGPRVRVAFTGDPLPGDRRDDLVPIVREGAVDEDLLEDSAQRIVEYFRGLGYRDATATFARAAGESELVVTFNIVRGPLYRIAGIEITGATSIPAAELAAVLRVREGQVFSAAALAADVSSLLDLYARRGYAQARAVPQAQPIASASDAAQVPVAVRIAITENVRTLVGSVRIDGNRSLSDLELTSGLGLQPGQPFFPTQLAVDRDAIELKYANAGFRTASVTSQPGLTPAGDRADVVFTVEEGPRIVIDHVLIVGNERTRTETIRRELQFKEGDPLGLAAVTESQRRLATLGLFRRTRLTELGHGTESLRDVLVTVEEAPATTLGYGGGLEAGTGFRPSAGGVASEQLQVAPRAFFEVGRRNLFGKNRSVNLFTRLSLRPRDTIAADSDLPSSRSRYGFSEYRVIGTYREPRVRNTAADAFLTGTIEQQQRSSFNFARRAFSAELLRRLTRELSVSGNYQIQRTELFDEKIDQADKLLIDRLFPQVRLSSFSLSAIRDGRDDLLDPRRGSYASVNGQLAARRIGSEVGLVKSFVTAQWFHPLPRASRVVLATSGRLGLASGFPRRGLVVDGSGGTVEQTIRDLPASERFFAGGDTTVRGFALDQLGTPATIDKDGFPIGGSALVIVNAELRMQVRGGLGLVGFFDSGNVFAKTTDIDLGALRSAIGFGVRYKSPVGPIRVDMGFKLRRRDLAGRREEPTAIHISLGQAF